MKPTKTWGSIFRNALRRGYDHGYSAHLADGWEIRQKKAKALKSAQSKGYGKGD